MHLVRRKLQRVRNSYYLNLPRHWVAGHKLRKNSTLGISTDENGRLIVEPVGGETNA